MIQAIIMDIDGVIVGEKIGVNSPDPNPRVNTALKKIHKNSIPICLCTAKPYFAILNVINGAGLDNLHITEGGGVIINPIDNVIVKKHVIDSEIGARVIEEYLKNNVYIEFYTVDDYYIQKNQESEIALKHAHVLQREPKLVDSLKEAALSSEIVKIMPIAKDEENKERLTKLFKPFENDLTLSWGIHPVALPLQFGIITTKGISKEQAAKDVSENLNIPFSNILGIGDSTSDWQFIKLCGYGVAMGNASDELKKLVLSKGEDNSYVCPTVDENGILKAFEYFKIA